MSAAVPVVDTRIDRAQFARDWEQWHRAHETRRADPHGFLAVTGLYWLGDRPIALADAPGTWATGPAGVAVDLADGERLGGDDAPITGRHVFGTIAERDGVTAPFEGGVIEIAKRGGRDILRPRRADAAFLASYAGTPTYLPNPRWRAEAVFRAFDQPRPITVGAAVDGIQHVYEAPGVLEFALRGETFELIAFPGHGPRSLLVLFTDATSGLTTYPANRAVLVDAPDPDGRTVLAYDFSRCFEKLLG